MPSKLLKTQVSKEKTDVPNEFNGSNGTFQVGQFIIHLEHAEEHNNEDEVTHKLCAWIYNLKTRSSETVEEIYDEEIFNEEDQVIPGRIVKFTHKKKKNPKMKKKIEILSKMYKILFF